MLSPPPYHSIAMDETPTLQQLLDKINQQVAILSQQNATLIHQVDMLQYHTSMSLIRLSLLKLPSKTATLNSSPISSSDLPPSLMLTASNAHQTLNTSLPLLSRSHSSLVDIAATPSPSPATSHLSPTPHVSTPFLSLQSRYPKPTDNSPTSAEINSSTAATIFLSSPTSNHPRGTTPFQTIDKSGFVSNTNSHDSKVVFDSSAPNSKLVFDCTKIPKSHSDTHTEFVVGSPDTSIPSKIVFPISTNINPFFPKIKVVPITVTKNFLSDSNSLPYQITHPLSFLSKTTPQPELETVEFVFQEIKAPALFNGVCHSADSTNSSVYVFDPGGTST